VPVLLLPGGVAGDPRAGPSRRVDRGGSASLPLDLSEWTRWWHREQSSTPLDRSVGSSRPTTSTNGNTAGLCGHLGRDDPRAAEDAAAGVEIVGDDRDVLHRAAEAIELPDGEDVARPKDRHHGVESGPVGATCGDMLLEDLRAAGAAEGVETRSQPTPRRPSSSNCVWMTDATADSDGVRITYTVNGRHYQAVFNAGAGPGTCENDENTDEESV